MKDYTKYSFYITALVVVILLGISFVPPFSMGGINFKRANIISEIYQFDDKIADREIEISDDDKAFIEELDDEFDTFDEPKDEPQKEESWNLGESSVAEYRIPKEEWQEGDPAIRIEDYSDEEGRGIADFCALLGSATENRLVRLGFLGDSYIEGDIITADIRQQLQERYGGGGVGFMPFDSPLSANKPTVKHTFGGWKNYNLIYKRNAPEELQDKFYISGNVLVPADNAWAEYETTNFRRNLANVSMARLIFTNKEASTITMVVNDTIERQFTPPASELPQIINISGGRLKNIRVEVENGEGFYGYGVVMEGSKGVALDNYSIRGNSGLALFGTNSSVNRKIDQALDYDLIVLQYGLNIMEAEVTGYAGYGKQLRRLINYMKSCFPKAAIVVLGVGDRCMQQDGEFVTMPAVPGMIAAQRAAARDCGVAFWSIYDVMAHYGGMIGFVEKGWAAKDYTHLSYGGGRRIAQEFVKALDYVKRHSEVELSEEESQESWQPVESISSFGVVGEGDSVVLEEGDTLLFGTDGELEEQLRPQYDTIVPQEIELPDSLIPQHERERRLQREQEGDKPDSLGLEGNKRERGDSAKRTSRDRKESGDSSRGSAVWGEQEKVEQKEGREKAAPKRAEEGGKTKEGLRQ